MKFIDQYREITTGVKVSAPSSPDFLMDTKDWSVMRLLRPAPQSGNWSPGWSMKDVMPGYKPQLPTYRAFGLW